jgi:hypothetical protein
MIGAFNSIYTALQGFFSRGFWFSAFLPVAIFSGIHALLAKVVYGSVSFFGFKPDFENNTATSGTLVLLALVVIAYALLPLLPRFRGILDGSLLPAWIHDALRARRLSEARVVMEEIDAARNELGMIDETWRDAHSDKGRLAQAYQAATQRNSALNSNAATLARQSVDALAEALLSSGPLGQTFDKALTDVMAALAVNNPDLQSLRALIGAQAAAAQAATAQATGQAGDDFEELLGRCRTEALYRKQILETRHRVLGALYVPRATAVGDARFVVERYASDAYKVEFDYLWPRLLVAMKAEKANDSLLEDIEQARTKVDFAVLSLALATSIPLVWLPLLLYQRGSPWVFLAIGAVTPPVLGFFYELVFESQLAFGEVVKTAIDRSRFLVLKMLGQAEPTSRWEERALWTRIASAEEDARGADLLYVRSSGQTVNK